MRRHFVDRVGKSRRTPLAAVMDREQGYGLDTPPTVSATPGSGRSTTLRRGFRHEISIRVRLRDVTQGRIPFEPLRDATQDLKTCAYCFSKQPKMKRCVGCRWARYCNRGCQTAHWRAHRQMCCPWPYLSEGAVATVTEAGGLRSGVFPG